MLFKSLTPLLAAVKSNGFELIHFTSGETQLLNRENADMRFDTNNTERLRITSAGKIGINDNSPENPVDIRADNVMVQLEGTGGNGRQYSLCSTDDTTGASVGSAGQFVIYDDTSGVNRLNIDSSGRLLIGSSQNVNNDQLQVNTSGGSNLGLSRFANNAGGPDLFLIKSRDTTFGNHTTVADNDVIGQIRFRADDGSDYVEGCRIFAKVNGSVSTNSVPTDLVFGSGTTGTERLRIGSSGQIGIGGENFGTSGQVLTSKGFHRIILGRCIKWYQHSGRNCIWYCYLNVPD